METLAGCACAVDADPEDEEEAEESTVFSTIHSRSCVAVRKVRSVKRKGTDASQSDSILRHCSSLCRLRWPWNTFRVCDDIVGIGKGETHQSNRS